MAACILQKIHPLGGVGLLNSGNGSWFHQSQLTQRDFATRYGVGLSTLSKWLRVEKEAASPPVKFQEVILPKTPMRYALEVVRPQGWTWNEIRRRVLVEGVSRRPFSGWHLKGKAMATIANGAVAWPE
jgi:hypothetical protein